MLQFHFNWETWSLMAGMTCVQSHLRLFAGTINGPQLVQFPAHLGRHLKGKLILVWDRLPAHRRRLVPDYLAEHPRLQQEWPPACRGSSMRSSTCGSN